MAFDQDPAVAALVPTMRNPDSARMGWLDPMAMDPDVAVPVPAVIAVDPDPAGMRWMVVDFDDGRRRCDANHDSDLRQSGGREETDSKQQ